MSDSAGEPEIVNERVTVSFDAVFNAEKSAFASAASAATSNPAPAAEAPAAKRQKMGDVKCDAFVLSSQWERILDHSMLLDGSSTQFMEDIRSVEYKSFDWSNILDLPNIPLYEFRLTANFVKYWIGYYKGIFAANQRLDEATYFAEIICLIKAKGKREAIAKHVLGTLSREDRKRLSLTVIAEECLVTANFLNFYEMDPLIVVDHFHHSGPQYQLSSNFVKAYSSAAINETSGIRQYMWIAIRIFNLD